MNNIKYIRIISDNYNLYIKYSIFFNILNNLIRC